MKKKFREITVDGVKYGWNIRCMGTTLVIWKDKKEILELKINEFDNTESELFPVTPKFVEQVIKENNCNLL